MTKQADDPVVRLVHDSGIYDANGTIPGTSGVFLETASGRRISVTEKLIALLMPPAAGTDSKGSSPATEAAFIAFLHYNENVGIKSIPDSKLAQLVAEHAVAQGLSGAAELSPTGSSMRRWAKLAKMAVNYSFKPD